MKRDQIHLLPAAIEPRSVLDWTALLNAVGSQNFECEFKSFLSRVVPRQGCIVFSHEMLGDLGTDCSFSTAPDRQQAGACMCSSRDSLQWVHFEDGPWRAAIGISFRSGPSWAQFSDLSHRVAAIGSALAAVWRVHSDRANSLDEAQALSCLSTIEACLADCSTLSSREIDVCSRVLLGLSSIGIALDLNLGETTIKTHRKRAYHRLAIGSERELIAWYLRNWATWHRSARRGEAIMDLASAHRHQKM